MRSSRSWTLGICLCAIVGASCSLVLGLDPPPESNETTESGIADATSSDAPVDAGPPICTPLDNGGSTTWAPLTQTTFPNDAGSRFELFEYAHTTASIGGVYDGRYLYFAGRGALVLQYDSSKSFSDPASWEYFNVQTVGITGGFGGAVYDNEQYVYFVPYSYGATRVSVVARYDTHAQNITTPTAWTSFDMSSLGAADAGLSGFLGGSFDGRHVYFVPRSDGVAATGRVVGYDTKNLSTPVDAGDAGDAGDAAPTGFENPAQWSTFDLTTVNSVATGYYGSVFDGKSLYLVPSVNNAFGNAVHLGASGIAAKFTVDGGITNSAAWSTFDMTTVSGYGFGFAGGASDGRYIYYSPNEQGVVVRYDTTLPFGAASSWSSYDMTRVIAIDASIVKYVGAAFDGRFVYFIPTGTNYATLIRYDTLSSFTADCAWSTIDLSQVFPGDGGAANFSGGIYDGQYLYLIPTAFAGFVRFNTKTPPSMPVLPQFNGSTL